MPADYYVELFREAARVAAETPIDPRGPRGSAENARRAYYVPWVLRVARARLFEKRGRPPVRRRSTGA